MIDWSSEFSNLNLTEVTLICELQEKVFSLSESTLESTVKYVSESIFSESKERIEQLVANIFNAIKIRPSSTLLYATFTKELILLASPENKFKYINSIILQPFPSVNYPSFDRFSFINECLKLEIISEKQIINSLKFNFDKNSHVFLPWKYSFVWFMPLIFKNDSNLFQTMFLELKKFVDDAQNVRQIKNVDGQNKKPINNQSAEIINNNSQAKPSIHSNSLEDVKKTNFFLHNNHGNNQKTQSNVQASSTANLKESPNSNSGQVNDNSINLGKANSYSILKSLTKSHPNDDNDQEFRSQFNNPTRELGDVVDSVYYLKEDNWNLYNKMVFGTYVPNSLPAILKEDRARELALFIDKYNKKERKRIAKIEEKIKNSVEYEYEEEEDFDGRNSISKILEEDRKEKEKQMEKKIKSKGKTKSIKFSDDEDDDDYEYETSSYEEDAQSVEESNKDLDSNENDPESYSIRFRNTSDMSVHVIQNRENSSGKENIVNESNNEVTKNSERDEENEKEKDEPEGENSEEVKNESNASAQILQNEKANVESCASNEVVLNDEKANANEEADANIQVDQNGVKGNKEEANVNVGANKQDDQIDFQVGADGDTSIKVVQSHDQIIAQNQDERNKLNTVSAMNQSVQGQKVPSKSSLKSDLTESNETSAYSYEVINDYSSEVIKSESKLPASEAAESSTQTFRKRRKVKIPSEVPQFVGFDLNQRIISTAFEKNNFLRNGPTLVQFAAFYGSVLCVTELVKRGVDLSIPDLTNKKTAMFAIAGGNMKIIEIFEYKQVDFTATPQVAAYFIQQDAFKRLMMTERFDLSHVDLHYASVLHQAAASNNIRVIIYCIEHGVSINIRNVKNMTPLHFAVMSGQLDAVLLLASHKDVEINAKANDGATPLILAAKNGFAKIVSGLLSNDNIDVNEFDNKHLTALHWAVLSNCLPVVKLLVEHKSINLEIKDGNQRTAEDLATLNGFKDCAKFISDHTKSDCCIA